MKVVISGGTGYIGGEVLTQCLNHSSITSVLVLARRELPDLAQHAKIKVIILKDFTSYDESTTNELKTADGALWCLGTYNGDEKIDIDFPLTFINTIKSRPPGSRRFRYVQLGGAFTEPPPKEGEEERSLWFFVQGRRVRGRTEAKVLEMAEDGADSAFTVNLVKPAAVFSKNSAILQRCLVGDSMSVVVDQVAATMVDLVVYGSEQKVFNNREIAIRGRELLKKQT